MRALIILTVSALTLVLGGCNVYKKYNRPENLDIDEHYRSSMSADTANIASLSWQQMLVDPYLQGLIQRGLDNNIELRKAELKIREAEEVLSVSRKAFLPSLAITADGGLSSFDGKSPTKTYAVGLNASWEVDLSGRLTNEKRESSAAFMEQHTYGQSVKTQLIASIAESYYRLLALDEKVRISKETLRNWDDNIRVMTALKKAGETNESALNQARANRLSVEISISGLEREISNVENAICSLLSMSPDSIRRGNLSGAVFPDSLAVGVPIQLLRNRPDVKRVEYALEKAFYSTNKARSAFYPSLNLSGMAGWTNSVGSVIVNPGKVLLSALGSLMQPLFNKGVNKANLNIAKARQESAMLDFRQTVLDAGIEVNDALTQWQSARYEKSLIGLQSDELKQAVHNTRLNMKHSKITYLEVLTAEQSLLSSQLTYVSAQQDEITAIIRLYHALGGGIY